VIRPSLRFATLVVGVLVLAGVTTALAQRGGFGGRRGGSPVLPNTPYDGKFTFVRLRYGPPVPFVSQRVEWSHDYPTGERNFMRILNEVTFLKPHIEATNILALDDPDLFHYPVAYLCEPGYQWTMSDEEAAGFRAYLQKGGFLIVDDFRADDWPAFDAQMRRVLPGVRYVDLDATHPIFHAFFEIDNPADYPNFYDPGEPIFRGIYEDNDPKKRLLAIINYNTDISEFWEYSGTGFRPIDESNDAYKLGVNYVVYGMTH